MRRILWVAAVVAAVVALLAVGYVRVARPYLERKAQEARAARQLAKEKAEEAERMAEAAEEARREAEDSARRKEREDKRWRERPKGDFPVDTGNLPGLEPIVPQEDREGSNRR